MRLSIGVDFDNTMVTYDAVFYRRALEAGWIDAIVPARKNAVRDMIRSVHGNDRWTELQGWVYGEGIREAASASGLDAFLDWTKQNGIPICIVSHKTRTAAIGPDIDLRRAARDWLETRGFLSGGRLFRLQPDPCVFFEETREAKISRIGGQGLTHFIDDLAEVFEHPGFPASVTGIHYNPAGEETPNGVLSCRGWDEIREYFRRLIDLEFQSRGTSSVGY